MPRISRSWLEKRAAMVTAILQREGVLGEDEHLTLGDTGGTKYAYRIDLVRLDQNGIYRGDRLGAVVHAATAQGADTALEALLNFSCVVERKNVTR